jgi:hypothetical protein
MKEFKTILSPEITRIFKSLR